MASQKIANCCIAANILVTAASVLIILSFILSGCTLTTEYSTPQIALPDYIIDNETAEQISDKKWWEQFNDPVLTELITSAIQNNHDLKIALFRIEEYAARKQVVESAMYPQVSYGQEMSRRQNSLEKGDPPWHEKINPSFSFNANIKWELDLWGKIRQMSNASKADLLAKEESRRALLLKLVSDVATAYINLLNLDKQLAHAKATYAERKELQELFDAKWRGGQISLLELSQVKSSFAKIAAEVPKIEMLISLQENAISILLGRFPSTIMRKMNFDSLIMPDIPPGIPASILLKRPDIMEVEQRMAAAHARLNVARLQYLPDISLTGSFGYASRELPDLLTGPANFWHIGQELAGIIFSGGRIEGDIKAAKAIQMELLNEYEFTIKNALREINDALVTCQRTRQMLAIQQERIETLKEYLEIAKNRFDSGYASSYLEVVDAQRSLYEAQVKYSNTRFTCYSAIINIYKAMGGSWIDSVL